MSDVFFVIFLLLSFININDGLNKGCFERCLEESCGGPLHNIQCDGSGNLAKSICAESCMEQNLTIINGRVINGDISNITKPEAMCQYSYTPH